MSQSALQPRRKILFTFPNLLLVSLIRRTEQKPVGKELKKCSLQYISPFKLQKRDIVVGRSWGSRVQIVWKFWEVKKMEDVTQIVIEKNSSLHLFPGKQFYRMTRMREQRTKSQITYTINYPQLLTIYSCHFSIPSPFSPYSRLHAITIRQPISIYTTLTYIRHYFSL